MSKQVKKIPEGFHSITPGLTVKDGEKAINFYKEAFSAEELMRLTGPGDKGVAHAQLRIGDSFFFLGEEMPDRYPKSPQTLGGAAGSFYLHVQDVDDTFNKAVKAGAKVEMPVADMFWGDRCGVVLDPFGHQWMVATHIKDVTPEEMEKGKKSFFEQAAQKK